MVLVPFLPREEIQWHGGIALRRPAGVVEECEGDVMLDREFLDLGVDDVGLGRDGVELGLGEGEEGVLGGGNAG